MCIFCFLFSFKISRHTKNILQTLSSVNHLKAKIVVNTKTRVPHLRKNYILFPNVFPFF